MLQQVRSEFVLLLVKSYSVLTVYYFVVHRAESFLPVFFKVYIDYLFDNLESGKNLLFRKKFWKKC